MILDTANSTSTASPITEIPEITEKVDLSWRELWEKSKVEVWSICGLILLSFVAALVRTIKKRLRRDVGGHGSADGGPSITLANLSNRAEAGGGPAEEGL